MKKILILVSAIVLGASFTPILHKEKKAKLAKAIKIKPIKKENVKYREPSEVVLASDTSKLYILADKAFLYETDFIDYSIYPFSLKIFLHNPKYK